MLHKNQTDGTIENAYMAKIPYTEWAGTDKSPVNKTDSYNFADGLEQRYGIEALGSRENQLFQKLNGIGNNEEVLLYQAMDEWWDTNMLMFNKEFLKQEICWIKSLDI